MAASAALGVAADASYDMRTYLPAIEGQTRTWSRTETAVTSIDGVSGLPERNGFSEVDTVEAAEVLNAQAVDVILTQIDGFDMRRTKTRWADNGLVVVQSMALDEIEPLEKVYLAGYEVVVPARLTVGQSVQVDVRYRNAGSDSITREELTWTAIGMESVEVEAGRFEALRVEVSGTIASPYTNVQTATTTEDSDTPPPLSNPDVEVSMPSQFTAIYHYVQGVGLVQAEETTLSYGADELGHSLDTSTTVERKLISSSSALPVVYENGARLLLDVEAGEAPLSVTFTLENIPQAAYVTWDFNGDGVAEQIGSTTTATHVYRSAGTFTAAVSANVDGVAYTFGGTVKVSASAQAPSVTALEASSTQNALTAPAEVTLRASMATADSGAAIVAYRWDVDGDGRIDRVTTAPEVTYLYTVPGEISAVVTAVDENGLEARERTQLTILPPVQPSIVLASPIEGETLPLGYNSVQWKTILPEGVQVERVRMQLIGADEAVALEAVASADDCRAAMLLWDSAQLSAGTYRLVMQMDAAGQTVEASASVMLKAVTLSAPAKETTTLAGIGVNRLMGQGEDGGVFVMQTASADKPATIPVSGVANLTVPPGACEDGATIRVFQVVDEPAASAARMRVRAGTVMTGISLDIDGETKAFAQPVAISLQYRDADADGILDEAGIPVASLGVFTRSAENAWVEVPAVHDAATGCFSFETLLTGEFLLQRARADDGLASEALVDLTVNGDVFATGETFAVRLSARSETAAPLDVYVALLLNDQWLFLRAPGAFYPAGEMRPLEDGAGRDLLSRPYFNTILLEMECSQELSGVAATWYAAVLPCGVSPQMAEPEDVVITSGASMRLE